METNPSRNIDIRIARKGAGKVGLPEVNLGVLPGTGGTQRLGRLIGKSKAIEIMATAEMFDFDRAESLGIVNQVWEAESHAEFMEKIMDYASQFAPPNMASKAIGAIKRSVQTGVGATGEFWAHEAIGVEPDIICGGKGLQIDIPSANLCLKNVR